MVTRRALWAAGLTVAVAACSQVSKLDRFEFVDACLPESADATCKGVACGPRTNNCGEPVMCPDTCTAPDTCGDNASKQANLCGCTPGDSPTKCCVPEALDASCKGLECGGTTNNCGEPVMCPDTCTAPETCGDNAKKNANACGCVSPDAAVTCASVACGTVTDKCTLSVACPSTCKPLYGCAIGGAASNTCGCTGGAMQTPPAPDGCTAYSGEAQYGNEGRTYYVCGSFEQPKGRAFCQAFGTDLAQPKTSLQNTFLASIVPANPWLGIEDPSGCPGAKCAFAWLDGTELSFTNFAFGEPSNNSGNEHCIELNRFGAQWNDVPCAFKQLVVCETTCPGP